MSTSKSSPQLNGMPPDAAQQSVTSNLCVLHGVLSSDPVERELPSGSSLVQLQVTTPGARAESVPVVSIDGPKSVGKLRQGDQILVIGKVCRRFFRAGGSTVSRTEVVASRVAKASAKRSIGVALAAAAAQLEDLAGPFVQET